MSKLYVMGGVSKVGKTTILQTVLSEKHLAVLPVDAIREGVRNLLIDEPYVTIDSISYQGEATFRRPGDLTPIHKKFTQEPVHQDELGWKAALGYIHYFDRHNVDLFVEGLVRPEHLDALSLKNTEIRAAFLGFLDESFIDQIIKYAYEKKGWVYVLIQEHNGDETAVREWGREQIKESLRMQEECKKRGYAFFDVSSMSFEEYTSAVKEYFLE